MRLELRADRSGALPVLPAVPSHRICKLEGYNGIGKTLSVRLLEVCTGRQPYRGHRLAWNALRAGLGPVTVRVSELTAGAETIEWTFDTSSWGEVDEDIADEWFDIWIDGNKGDLDEVRNVLSVHRIAGNEGLVGTLAEQIRADAALVQDWQERYVARDKAPLRSVLALVGKVRDLLTGLDDLLYRELVQQAEEAAATARALHADLERDEQKLEKLERAATIHARLAELDAAGGTLEKDLTSLDRNLKAADERTKKIRGELSEVEQRVEKTAAVREELQAARRLRERRLNRVESAAKELARLLQVAEVEDPSTTDESTADVRSELERLVVRRAAVDAGPRVRQLLRDLSSRLQRAEREGLSTQEILAASGVTLSVADAREAFERRAQALAGEDETDAGQALTRRIGQYSARLRALEEIPEQARKVMRARELLEEADEQIRLLVDAADEKAGDEAERLRRSLRDAEDEVRQVAVTRATLRRRQEILTGGGSADDLGRELDELTSSVGTTADKLPADVAKVRASLAALQLKKEEAELREHEAAARVAHQTRLVNDAVTALAFADEYRWMRYVDPDAVPAPDDPVERKLELLAATRGRIDRVAGRLGDLGRQLGGVWRSLEDLAEQVRSGQAASDGRGYLPALRASLGEQYSGYFNETAVRMALLPTASKATINLGAMTVDWDEPDGEGGSRPLEAFSSGQQAFAYTRARLAGLDLEPGASAANRLIALDEFGAFVARDRIDDLITMLREHRDRHHNDQLVVILPVAEDYPAQLAAEPPEHLRPRLERIAHELKERRYFAEEFAV